MTMHRDEYLSMRAAEDVHWWYRSLHRYLLRFLPQSHGGVALDIGCGTGAWLAKLAARGYQVFGLDVAHLAAALSLDRGLREVTVGSANELPLQGDSFDLVTCIDVLEVGPVDPQRAVAEALRVLRPGGYGLFVMAAHQWMLSEHDRAVGSVRRYNLAQFRALFQGHAEILKAGYLFFTTFPFLALRKLLNPPRPNGAQAAAVSDVSLPHPLINSLLWAYTSLETALHPNVKIPIGSSVCALVRKT